MKKVFVLLLAVVLCLGLCACDAEAILDGVSDMLDGNDGDSGRTENAVDQMIPAGDSDVFGSVIWTPAGEEGNTVTYYVDEDGNLVYGTGNYDIEIIDGVIYINGEAAGEVKINGDEDNAYSFIINGGSDETDE